MLHRRVVRDPDECRALWRRMMPSERVTDLWEVRECFQRHFRRPPYFLVAEDSDGLQGLLPLSWIEESRCFGFFPGETWHGKTWIEQNRIPTRREGVLAALLDACPSTYHLRYLTPESVSGGDGTVDEIGYLFCPADYDYDMDRYYRDFSRKSAKRLERDLADLGRPGVEFRCDEPADFDLMVTMNLDRFGASSFFADPRFREGFRSLRDLLMEKGWLRMTTVLIGGRAAAVDMGCLYGGVYTLLAGGTHADFPGVAKLINTHHMTRACRERLPMADFLCGDFSWKTLFHLKPRPLYLLAGGKERESHDHVVPHAAALVG